MSSHSLKSGVITPATDKSKSSGESPQYEEYIQIATVPVTSSTVITSIPTEMQMLDCHQAADPQSFSTSKLTHTIIEPNLGTYYKLGNLKYSSSGLFQTPKASRTNFCGEEPNQKQSTSACSLTGDAHLGMCVTTTTTTYKKTSISSSSSCICRICQSNTCRERLISPCNCKGSLAYVHLSCLERWLNQASRSYCELCLFQFNSVLSQRYGLCESLRLWIRHPRNRNNLQSDVLISCLLTIVTGGLITVCLLGMQYFVLEGHKLGISRAWTRGAISFFLSVVLFGYLITLYLLIKDQFLPWYRWWRHTLNVRLILTPTSGGSSNQHVDI